MRNRSIGFFLALAGLPVSAANGPEFIGRWVHVKYPSMRVEVTQNGSAYIVAELKEKQSTKHPARFIDGMLVANTGPCSINADIEQKTGNLLFAGKEYRRLKVGESFDYVKPGIPKGW